MPRTLIVYRAEAWVFFARRVRYPATFPTKLSKKNDADISVLNCLVKTTLGSMKGYENAAKDAESTPYATMVADFAHDRAQL